MLFLLNYSSHLTAPSTRGSAFQSRSANRDSRKKIDDTGIGLVHSIRGHTFTPFRGTTITRTVTVHDRFREKQTNHVSFETFSAVEGVTSL